MRARLHLIFLSILACLALAAPLPALADSSVNAASGVSMAATVGFAGEAKLGSWVPVQVDVANDGRDLAGRIEVQFESNGQQALFGPPPAVYSTPATFPQHSHKRLVVDVPVPPTVQTNRVQVRLVSGDQTIAQRDQEFDPLGAGSLLCGVLDQTLGAYDFLANMDLPGRQQRPKIADLTLADLPAQAPALDSLDCLVIGDVNLSAATTDQMTALQAWVAHGGLLVVVGGVNWQQSLPALPQNLLPVHVTGIGTLNSIAPLDQFAHTNNAGPGPWPIARGTLVDGAAVVGDQSEPLLAARRVGNGAVFFYALDPTQEPARSWAGNHFLWQYMLGYVTSPVVASPYQQSLLNWGTTPMTALSALPDLNPPPPVWLLLFLAGYALLLGPGAFLLLRRLDRLEWLLVILPVAAVLGAAGTVRLAQDRQSSDIAVTEVTLLRAEAASPVALAHSYVGLFAPRPQAIDLHVPQGSLLAAARRAFGQPASGSTRQPMQVSEGMDVTVPAVRLAPGALTTFSVDTQSTLGGGVVGSLTADSQLIRGQVQNKTGQRLNDAFLVVGSSVYPLGVLNPNETRSISMAASNPAADAVAGGSALAAALYPGSRALGRTTDDPRRDILDRVFATTTFASSQPTGGALLVGWLDQSPLQVDIRHARAATRQWTLLEARLPLTMAATPPTTISSNLLEEHPLLSLGVTETQAGHYSVPAGGSFGVEYDLPRTNQLTVQDLHVQVAGSYSGGSDLAKGANLGSIAVYDWALGDWRTLPLVAGENDYGSAASYVSPMGQVRLRYSYKAAAGSAATGIDFSQFAVSVSG